MGLVCRQAHLINGRHDDQPLVMLMPPKLPPYPPSSAMGANPKDAAFQRTLGALRTGRPAEAEHIANELLRSNAGDLRAMQLKGMALMMQDRAAEAIAPLERVAKQSRDPSADTQFALALKQSGRRDDALMRLERTVKRHPTFPPAFLELGSLLTALGRPSEAIAILLKGVAIAPNFADLFLALGQAQQVVGDKASARRSFEQAVTLAPQNMDAMFACARACQADCDYTAAAQLYRRMLSLAPNDGAAQIGLGVCLLEMGDEEEGIQRLRAASRLNAKLFGEALAALVSCGRGKFWLKPSDAEKYLRGMPS